jgi:hypothetical protein
VLSCIARIILNIYGATDKLSNSKYGSLDDIEHMADCFDKSAKLSFKDPSQTSLVKFGSARDVDNSVGIKFGQLKLQGSETPRTAIQYAQLTVPAYRSEVATFFEPSITAIKHAIQSQKAAAHVPVKVCVLIYQRSQYLIPEVCFACRRICCEQLAVFRA